MTDSKQQNTLTHIDAQGHVRMVDVGEKQPTHRIAIAESYIQMNQNTLDAILGNTAPKGDVLATARIAGIQAAKKTSDMIPLCHPLMLDKVEVEITPCPDLPGFRIETTVSLHGKTGVEMEALCAASTAALTIYDMAKAIDKHMIIGPTKVLSKKGGKSGDWTL